MPCPICYHNPGEADHRLCLVELFRNNTIQSVKEWETLCKPKTIRKGKIVVYLSKTDFETTK